MAEVWRARDERSGRRVAVKLLHPHLLPDQASRARLASEARAVGGLDHPGIIRVLAADAGERPAVVLELVEGEPLSARLERDGPLDPRAAAEIGAEVAEALYHAHTRGVIHRDVKPGNVLIGTDGRARLVDFGIARLLGEVQERTTQTGMVMGTLRYMAPEQLAGKEVGPRVDLYGLGALLYEMLSGRPPHSGSSPAALLREDTDGPPVMDGIDATLAAVVVACLQPRPEDRPRHAGEVGTALRAWLAGDASGAIAHITKHQDETLTQAQMTPSAPAARSVRHRRVGRRVAAMAGALVAAAAVLVVAVALSGPMKMASAAATPFPTPMAALPSWAAQLADKQRSACGSGPSAAELAAMSRAAATEQVTEAIADCKPAGGEGRGHGKEKH
ncbi:MAG: serine/threonine protein kinase [Chloroflexi bacterium]|nr:MAG: serine/threonine protein kinase [Chloroflexota bacterium]